MQKLAGLLSSSEDLLLITVSCPDGHEVHGNNLTYWLRKRGLTIWDFILHEDKQRRAWYDAEECIKDWVDYSSPSASDKPHIQQICNNFRKIDKDY